MEYSLEWRLSPLIGMIVYSDAIYRMPSPSYKELEDQIGECMLADRFRMRREIKKKRARGKL